MTKLIKDSFKAWIDNMPGSPRKLIVTGKLETPTAGWTAKLRYRIPQGINPKILLLDAEATKPSGPAVEVISQVDVRYEETPPQQEYTDVTVFCGDESHTIKVGTTH